MTKETEPGSDGTKQEKETRQEKETTGRRCLSADDGPWVASWQTKWQREVMIASAAVRREPPDLMTAKRALSTAQYILEDEAGRDQTAEGVEERIERELQDALDDDEAGGDAERSERRAEDS